MKKNFLAILILVSVIFVNVAIFLQFPYSKVYNDNFKSTNIRMSAQDITIITPENITYTEPMSGYYPATYGFEEDEIGDNGTIIDFVDIDNSGAGCSANIEEEIDEHRNVLEMKDNSGDYSNVQHILDSAQTSGSVEVWLRTTDANKYSVFNLRSSAQQGSFISINNNKFRYYDGSYHDIRAAANNTWYHIRVDFECGAGGYEDLEADEYNIWINGIKYGEYPFWFDLASIERISFNTRTIDIGYSYYVDAVGCSWDPSYNIGDNLNEGLLVSFENSSALDWMGYSLDEQANKTVLGNTTIPIPSDGPHNIQVFGNNSIGANYHSDIRYFKVDTTPPQLSIIYPTTGAEFSNPPSFILSITEESIASTWYTLNGGSNITFTGNSGVIDSTAWYSLLNGPITIRFYVRDIIDNEDFDEVVVIKATSQETPPGIPGYNILILIGISCIIIGVFTKRKFKF